MVFVGFSIDYKEAVNIKSDIPFRCHIYAKNDFTETDQETTNNMTETENHSIRYLLFLVWLQKNI